MDIVNKPLSEVLFLCQINTIPTSQQNNNLLWQKRAQKELPLNILTQKSQFPSYSWKKYIILCMRKNLKILKIFYLDQQFELYISLNDTLNHILTRSLRIIHHKINLLKGNYNVKLIFNDSLMMPSGIIIDHLNTTISGNWNSIDDPKLYIIPNGSDITVNTDSSSSVIISRYNQENNQDNNQDNNQENSQKIQDSQESQQDNQEPQEGEDCCICMDECVKISELLKCKHPVCKGCLSQLKNPICPICRQTLEGETVTSEILVDIMNRQEQEKANALSSDYLTSIYLFQNPGANPEEVYNQFN
jgi:hypothetical protein